MTTMTTVQLITQARGGPVDHAVDVALQLRRDGHRSHLVGPPGEYGRRLVDSGVDWTVAEVRDKFDLRGARAVGRLIDRIGPDVLHCHDRRAGLIGRLGRRRSGACVYTLHGVPDSLAHLVRGNLAMSSPRARDVIGGVAEHLLATTSSSMTVVPCAAVADFAIRRLRLPADRVVVAPNGVAPEWSDVPPEREERKAAPTAVWLGVMQPVKRVPELVHAVAAVPSLRLVLVGDGPERHRVEAAVADSGAADRVVLAGYQPDPMRLLAAADVFVLPSAAEACPMAILQAMACGLPVVASSVGGVPEVVRDGIDGILVPAGDDVALREALDLLAGDAAMRRRLGDSARRRAREHYSTQRCVERIVEVYRAVAR